MIITKGDSHRPLPATALPQQTFPIQMEMETRPSVQYQTVVRRENKEKKL